MIAAAAAACPFDWMIDWKQQRRVRRGETEREEADPLVGWNEQIPWGEEVIHSSFVTYGCGWPRRRKEPASRVGWWP